MKRFIVACLGLGAACLFASPVLYSENQAVKVPYPEGYRHWFHVKTMAIQEGHPLYEKFGGIHHVYANDPAACAMKKAKPDYPNGAVLVLDLHCAVREGHALSEGARQLLCVMKRNKKLFADTGGWGFEAFSGNSRKRLVIDAKTQCFRCHTARSDQGFVYSTCRG